MRNKKDSSFANMTKLLSKFSTLLVESNMDNLTLKNINSNQDLKEKHESLMVKIIEHLKIYKEIWYLLNFLFKRTFFNLTENNVRLIEKFLPSFKLIKYSLSEGKEKMVKKFKEYLDKRNINYDPVNIEKIILPIGNYYFIIYI